MIYDDGDFTFFSTDGKTKKDDEIYFGVEVEVEGNSYKSLESAARIIDRSQLFWYSGDGSLNHYGLEVKTMPFTWEFLEKNREMWQPLFDLEAEGFSDSERCGMHVHVSHGLLSDQNIFAIISFIYRNYDLSRWLSGRLYDSKYALVGVSDETLTRVLVSSLCRKTVSSKSMAVAFHEYETMELRLFQGTCNPTKYWERLESAAAIVGSVVAMDKEPSVDEFLEFCNQSNYEYLKERLKALPDKLTIRRSSIFKKDKTELKLSIIMDLLRRNRLHSCKKCARKILERIETTQCA